MASVADAFKPNRALDRKTTGLVIGAWVVVGFAVWFASPFASLPTPVDIWRALVALWWEGGLGPEIFTTMKLIGHATLLTVVLSMLLSTRRFFVVARTIALRPAPVMTAARSNATRSRTSFPDSIFDRSRMSSIFASSERPESRTWPRYLRNVSFSGSARARSV